MDERSFRNPRRYLVPLFRVLAERGPSEPAALYEEVADRAGVTADERRVEGQTHASPVYRNRIQFARQALIDGGLMIGSGDPAWRRGVWQLSPEGGASPAAG